MSRWKHADADRIRPSLQRICGRAAVPATSCGNRSLATGLLASLSHVFSTFAFGDNPFIPSLGASGAISGVMGGYLVLHPHRRVRVIALRMITEVPGWVAVGLWFVFQLISAFGVIGLGPQAGGGVAFMAHIGGFVAGVVLVKVFGIGSAPPQRRRPAW